MPESEQKTVIRLSQNSKQLVIAGPGTGKTYTLIERIKYLLNDGSIYASEILILSFSVSAVREIKNRLNNYVEKGELNSEAQFVEIRTFDSFGSKLIYEIDNNILRECLTYDDSIKKATELVLSDDRSSSIISRYKHIFVDEIQDIVGLRAELTLALLKNVKCGFTLFGDPAQAIYEYTTFENPELMSSSAFINKIRQFFYDLPPDIEFTQNFRTGEDNNLRIIAEKGRTTILNSDPVLAYHELRKIYKEFPSCGSLDSPEFNNIECNFQNNEAILCRTNGQALSIATYLYEKGIDFILIPRIEQYHIPSWIGKLFYNYDSTNVSFEEFNYLYEKKLQHCEISTNQVWELLFEILNQKVRSSFNILQLRKSLTIDRPPIQDILEKKKDSIIISTIHRSKGREYDNVRIVVNNKIPDNNVLKLDEARILFVGITRAKNMVKRIEDNNVINLYKPPEDRWIKMTKNKGIAGIEMGLYGDIDISSFVSSKLFNDDIADIKENQEDLDKIISRGDKVMLRLCHNSSKNILYEIRVYLRGQYITVGKTSVSFGQNFSGIMNNLYGSSKKIIPEEITGLWVSNIVTEVGNLRDEDVPRRYRTTGFWLGIHIQGLGNFSYN